MRLPFRRDYQTFRIGDQEVRLRIPKNLKKIDDLDEQAKRAGISKDAFPLFGIVWPSSKVLAQLMLGYKGKLAGKRILEVGCGMALTSHLLNAMKADITAMDIHPMVEDFLTGNAALNKQAKIPFVRASWAEELTELGPFDLIVGSDILYEPIHIRTLAPFFGRHVTAGGEVIIVDPNRGQAGPFEKTMKKHGFLCRSSHPDISDTYYEGVVLRFSRPARD